MNILLITPGINKKFNDNYYAYKHIANTNNNILAISNRENINKGGKLEESPEFETDGTLVIHRIFKSIREQQSFIKRLSHKKKIETLVSDFSPDIIFCEEISNLKFAIELKRKFKSPIVLRTEFAFNKNYPYRSMGRLLKLFKNSITGDRLPIFIGSLIWSWAYANSDAVISCYHDDALIQPMIKNTPFYYVPWPCYHPKISDSSDKLKYRAIFIGAFDPHKNLQEFLITIPKLLNESPLEEFIIVGSGEHINIIEKLKERFPESIKYYKSLSRERCLDLIQSSYFSYSPAIRGGWGFIGDSWAMKAPIVITHNHYGFNDNIDSIVASQENIVERVNRLYENETEYERIVEGGYTRYTEKHTAEAVGDSFLKICQDCIGRLNKLKTK